MAIIHTIGIVAFATVFAACGVGSGKSFVPSMEGYPEKQKVVHVLPDELLEVSGITHLYDNTIAAINDEEGILFLLNLNNDSMRSFKFKGKGDYEELVKTDSSYFILDSDGDLYEVKPPYTEHVTYKFDIEGKFEFESLVWYKKLNKLVVITKEQRKKSKSGITAYSFDLTRKAFDKEPFFEITLKEIFVKLENYNAECKPSAAALHPLSKRLYILASVGKVILECSPEGKIERIFKINPGHFPQPEGITFASNGDMYISNEGLDGKATILKYPYVAKK